MRKNDTFIKPLIESNTCHLSSSVLCSIQSYFLSSIIHLGMPSSSLTESSLHLQGQLLVDLNSELSLPLLFIHPTRKEWPEKHFVGHPMNTNYPDVLHVLLCPQFKSQLPFLHIAERGSFAKED
ncbi:hypothetical protein ATANTOWER_022369 [Ataeniobius toweri]|uniref:Uncharacterized protein n=1 Tax=Ataeniobius toweri TaxID=208326 RepID=A0ABU7C0H8_9TELE|nr:hypothetical protein [Ataeniobius toweri]